MNIRTADLGPVPPAVLATHVIADMEEAALRLWQRKQDLVSVMTWTDNRAFRVTCKGHQFTSDPVNGIYVWEEVFAA